MNGKKYLVFVGNFGSGKTELALHFAYAGAETGAPVTLVDLDIVNPYFRASEKALALRSAGVDIIAPRFALDNVEIITIDPRIYSAFTDKGGLSVFDVGGDNVGARAMGQYWNYFHKLSPEQYEVWMVINVHRPRSATAELIQAQLDSIEAASRLKVTGLINNSNLSYETCAEDILAGYHIIRTVADNTGLPVVYTSGQQEPLTDFLHIRDEQGLDSRYIGEPLFFTTRMHRDGRAFSEFGI